MADNTEQDKPWENVTSDRQAPWFQKSEGAVIEGYLLGRYTFGQGRDQRYFYQIKLTSGDAKGLTGKGEEQKSVTVGKGEVISVDESFALEQDLAPLAEDGGKYKVRLMYGKPERDGKGKAKFWPVKIQKQTLSPPTRTPKVKTRERDASEEEDGKIPF
jgi:hypothetical protein